MPMAFASFCFIHRRLCYYWSNVLALKNVPLFQNEALGQNHYVLDLHENEAVGRKRLDYISIWTALQKESFWHGGNSEMDNFFPWI